MKFKFWIWYGSSKKLNQLFWCLSSQIVTANTHLLSCESDKHFRHNQQICIFPAAKWCGKLGIFQHCPMFLKPVFSSYIYVPLVFTYQIPQLKPTSEREMERGEGIVGRLGRHCYAIFCFGMILIAVAIPHFAFAVEEKDPCHPTEPQRHALLPNRSYWLLRQTRSCLGFSFIWGQLDPCSMFLKSFPLYRLFLGKMKEKKGGRRQLSFAESW